MADFVHGYNTLRLHSGIGYVTPQSRLKGRDQQIMAEHRHKLTAARQARQIAHIEPCQSQPASTDARAPSAGSGSRLAKWGDSPFQAELSQKYNTRLPESAIKLIDG